MSDSLLSDLTQTAQNSAQAFPLPIFGTPLQPLPVWPKNVISTPLMDGVKLETGTNPPSAQIVVDLTALLNGGKAAGAVAKRAGKVASKAAAKQIQKQASETKPRTAPETERTLEAHLEGLKTLLSAVPGLGGFVPILNLALLLQRAF